MQNRRNQKLNATTRQQMLRQCGFYAIPTEHNAIKSGMW